MSKQLPAKSRITVFLDSRLADELGRLTREIRISRDALMDQTLPAELDYLRELPRNSSRAASIFATRSTPAAVRRA